MSELLDLAERCEAATGPDRELDVAIQDGLGTCLVPWNASPNDWLVRIGDEWVETRRVGRGGTTQDRFNLRYTASVDAALTLVPEGRDDVLMNAQVESFHVGENDRRHIARLFAPYCGQQAVGRSSASPALAICAAALRARSA